MDRPPQCRQLHICCVCRQPGVTQLCKLPPVSPALSWPTGPRPVASSPRMAATMPRDARRPANSSFCGVKPQSVTPKNFLGPSSRVILGSCRGPTTSVLLLLVRLKVPELGSRLATRLKPTRPARKSPTWVCGRGSSRRRGSSRVVGQDVRQVALPTLDSNTGLGCCVVAAAAHPLTQLLFQQHHLLTCCRPIS